MAEIARISDADIRITLHGSKGDSGQNEAEQTNSGVSNTICDGGTIEWEKHKRFEIDNLTLEQYNAIENQPDRKNAWSVAREISNRVDDAPCMGEHMKATTAIEPSKGFFWNKEYLEAFYKTQSLTAKQKIPGYFYICKITDFDELPTQSGELYREFLKGDCKTKTGELCDWCKAHSFRGPPCGHVPRPYPAEEGKRHYRLDVFQTPVCNTSGQPRAPDDFQPKANIKKLVKEGKT